jgi:hypothetical protein
MISNIMISSYQSRNYDNLVTMFTDCECDGFHSQQVNC